jgi:hypothetical protein
MPIRLRHPIQSTAPSLERDAVASHGAAAVAGFSVADGDSVVDGGRDYCAGERMI